MRPFILSALLLAAAAPGLAQTPPPDATSDHRGDHGDRHDNRGGASHDQGQRPDDHRQGGDHGNRGDDHGQRPDDHGQRPDDHGQRPDDHGQRPDDRGNRGDDRGFHGGDDRGGYRGDDRGRYRGDDRGRGDIRRDFRDDRRGYGDGDHFARFHGDRFFYPRGYGYRYYGIGSFLPRVFFDQRYAIADPYAYRLPPAFAGTHWVRVGPDALLIRNYDGRVVRAIQGLFY